MDRQYRTFALLLAVVFAFGAVAEAQLSDEYATWAEGPQKFLMTKDEIKEWKKITTDAEAKRFIELFWGRRDPDLDSPYNEFEERFRSLVRYADENFGYEGTRGALTDRAKVLILLGIPHQAERRAPTEFVQHVGTTTGQTGMGSDEVRSNAEMWTYDPERLPEGFKAKGTHILFVFYEEKMGSNNFTWDRSHREATRGLRTLAKAPEVLLVNPDLKEVPKPVSVPNGESATASQLAWLDSGTAPFNNDTVVVVESGVADAVNRPLWMHLELPEGAPALDTMVGRVSNPAGDVLSSFQIAATPIAPGARVYHLTFPLADGDYVIETAGVAAGAPQVVARVEATNEAIPLDGSWLSPIWFGLSAERDEGAALGMAYTFGGWHLKPLTASTISKGNVLSYFGFVVRPGLDPSGNPKIKAKIVAKKDGKRLGSALRLDLGAVKITGDLYLYANALDLSVFPAPGDFQLEFKIEDFVSKAKSERDVAFSLTE